VISCAANAAATVMAQVDHHWFGWNPGAWTTNATAAQLGTAAAVRITRTPRDWIATPAPTMIR
jgi:hypothetical protein